MKVNKQNLRNCLQGFKITKSKIQFIFDKSLYGLSDEVVKVEIIWRIIKVCGGGVQIY